MNEDLFVDDIPLYDATDIDILMHRDVHFGGNFDLMLEYYKKGGKGVVDDISVERIEKLQEIEKQTQQNLAPMLLSGADAERIAQAKAAYKRLKKLYQKEDKQAILIADLILSEEDPPTAEINAIVAEKAAITPALIELVRSEEHHDPLFPGYGLAPTFAVQCLGLIGDKRAIISLFESIGSDFFEDDIAIHALKQIGAPAKEFLLKVLHGKPYTFDNERAAMALLEFEEDPAVATFCLNMLKALDFKKDTLLASYLILVCEGLRDPVERKALLELASQPQFPSILQQDIKTVSKSWA